MIKKIKSLFEKYKIEAVLFTSSIEIFYLSKIEFDGWLLFVKTEIYAICLSNTIKKQFEKKSWETKINICRKKSLYKALIDILEQHKSNHILVDIKYINTQKFFLLEEILNQRKIHIIKKAGILENTRIIKNNKEIKNIKMSCKIASKICNIIKEELRFNISELDIHYRILELFAKNKVKESFIPIVASGINSTNPHHKSSKRKITKNDIVTIDLGCVYNGYCSDLTRTYFLGRLDVKRNKIWNVVKNSLDSLIKAIRSGVSLSIADKISRNEIKNAGYEDNLIHVIGHGIGLEVHETPILTSAINGVFLNGMILAIEPGIYIDNKFGIRIEDIILVKENYCEVLTSAVY
ncbi:MAG: M24 family metallopeptidase [Endomicrobium sp.]|jgi:Xaa-Pro aminopeptidase|nr:M24 family metallopeptidase [Endomicrobium sp.]